MEAHVKKTLHGWKPVDEPTEKYWKKGNLGDIYHFDIKKIKSQRNWKFLQKYWVMMTEVTENQERYRTKEDLHEAIKWELDITEIRMDIATGDYYKKIGSVAMDKMTEDEFSRYYSDAVDVILKYVLVGTTEDELNQRVMEILSFT